VHAPPASEARDNSPEFREAGLPHGGGFGTARAMAAFYQMMIGGGRLGAVRLFSKRMVDYVTRDFTGDRPDEGMAASRCTAVSGRIHAAPAGASAASAASPRRRRSGMAASAPPIAGPIRARASPSPT